MFIVPIPPKSLFHVSCGHSKYQFALCHEALRDAEYRQLYADYAKQPGAFVILDNGAFELGSSDIDVNLVEMTKAIEPQEIVLPDRMFMADATVAMSKRFKERHPTLCANRSIAGVAHGRNHEEFLHCAKELIEEVGVDVIMIPKDYEAWSGGRDVLVAMLQCFKKPIHLLGMEQDCGAFMRYTTMGYVRSMDTVKPFTRAMSMHDMFSERIDISRPFNYFERVLNEDQYHVAIDNLKQWSEAARAR